MEDTKRKKVIACYILIRSYFLQQNDTTAFILPHDVLYVIMKFLDPENLIKAECVCKGNIVKAKMLIYNLKNGNVLHTIQNFGKVQNTAQTRLNFIERCENEQPGAVATMTLLLENQQDDAYAVPAEALKSWKCIYFYYQKHGWFVAKKQTDIDHCLDILNVACGRFQSCAIQKQSIQFSELFWLYK
jgi:hypothetical protein